MSKMNRKEVQDIHTLLTDLYPPTIYRDSFDEKINDSYVRLYNIGTSNGYMHTVNDLLDFEYLYHTISKLPKENLGITFNTFSNCKNKNKLCSLFGVKVLVLDIDYKTSDYPSIESVLYFLEEDYFGKSLPRPNYIEKGNQLRLIYILKEEVRLQHRKGAKLRDFVQFVNNTLSKKLNEFGADIQGINTYIRLPHSINTKNGQRQEVIFEKYSDYQYQFQEMVEEFLPDVPAWHKPKKEVAKTKKKRKSMTAFNKSRLEDFEKLQSYLNGIESKGHRELLGFLYRNYALLSGYSKTEALNLMLKFNQNWNYPLLDSKLIGATNNVNTKLYLYSNRELIMVFDLSSDLIEELGLVSIYEDVKAYTKEERSEYNHQYYMKHIRKSRKMTRSKLTQKIKQIILDLKLEKKTNKCIQTVLKYYHKIQLSIKSIERYVHTLIVANEYAPI